MNDKKKSFLAVSWFLLVLFLSVSVFGMDVSLVKGTIVDGDVSHDFGKTILTVSPEKSLSINRQHVQTLSITNKNLEDLYFFIDPYFDNGALKNIKLEKTSYKTITVPTLVEDCSVKQAGICSHKENGTKSVLIPEYFSMTSNVKDWGDMKHYVSNGVLIKSGTTQEFKITYTANNDNGKWNARVWANTNNDYSCVLDDKKTCLFDYTIDPSYDMSNMTINMTSYWSYDDNSGTIATDSNTTFKNNLTLNANTTWVAGKINSATNYTGFSNTRNTSALNMPTTVGSVSWWMKRNSYSSNVQYLWEIDDGLSTNRIIMGILNTDNSFSSYIISANVLICGNATLNMSLGTWYHFVYTWNTVTDVFNLYKDGVLISGACSKVVSNDPVGTNRVTVGDYASGPSTLYGYRGVYDEIGVWRREITANEVLGLYNGGSGCAYPFACYPSSGNFTVNYQPNWTSPLYETVGYDFKINFSFAENVSDIDTVKFNFSSATYDMSLDSNGTCGSNCTWKNYLYHHRIPLIDVNNTNATINITFTSRYDNGTNYTNTTTTYYTPQYWSYHPTNIYINNIVTEGSTTNWNTTYTNLGNNSGVTFEYITQYNNTNITGTHLSNSTTQINATFNHTVPLITTTTQVNLTPYINITFNTISKIRNGSAGASILYATQQITKFQNLTVTYSNNITNYVRNLTINASYYCNTTATGNLHRIINDVLESSTSITCNASWQELITNYIHSAEGNYSIYYTLEISPYYNVSSTNTTFTSDLYPPVISYLSFIEKTTSFNLSPTYNATMICYDNVIPMLNYTLIVNNVTLFDGNKSNNTAQTNESVLISGLNTLTGICYDGFENTTLTNDTYFYVSQMCLIDEIDNVDFNVSNLTGARVYLDDNSTYFDFKTGNTSCVNFSTLSDTKLRFELIPEFGTTITRWIDLAVANETSLRVCANKQGVTHYEQIIISAIVRQAVLKSVFADCYVDADFTRFAYQDAKALKAFTIQTLYYLYTLNSEGEQVILASVDGSIQTFINLDTLEFLSDPTTFSIIKSAMSFQKTANNTITISYNNADDDIVSGNLTITRLDTNVAVLSLNTFADYNSWTIVYDYSTLSNLSNNTVFSIQYDTINADGVEESLLRYFSARGTSGILRNEIAGLIAVLFLLFGLTLTSSKITFAWFGLFICMGNFLLLTLAVGGVWYIVFLQGITAIITVYIVINLISQNWETVT